MKPLLAALLLVTVAGSQTGETSMAFAGRTCTLRVPSGYSPAGDLAATVTPGATIKAFAFTTPQRSDGTTSVIQVSLLDLGAIAAAAKEPAPGLAKFASAAIEGIHRLRGDWKQMERALTVAGVPATRFDWSGTITPPPGRSPSTAPVPMHGLMIVGIKDGMGFVLHTQDFDTYWQQMHEAAEASLMTFTLGAGKVPEA